MQLAQRAVLEHTKALKLHRQHYPAEFERVIEQEGACIRYYSDVPALLYGEYVLSQLKQHAPLTDDSQNAPLSERFVYVERLDEHQWYMATFQHHQLSQEASGNLTNLLSQLGYDLHHATQLWVTHDDFYQSYDKDDRCQSLDISFWDNSAQNEYELETAKAKKMPVKWVITLVAVLLIAGGLATYYQATKPKPVKRSKAEIASAKYLKRYQTRTVNAHDALINARNLLIEASVMPKGMNADKVVLDKQKLIMRVENKDLKTSVIHQWFDSHPTLAALYDKPDFVLPLPAPKPWQALRPIGYHRLLTESVQRLGGTIDVEKTQTINGTSVTTYRVKTSGEIGHVGILADVLHAPFVALNTLQMSRRDPSITLDISLDVQGEPLS
ncbi:TPA: hypothetical protein ACVU43_004221 [Vibrio parahaemolyticus]|nr:hypothetical protein [Vibrio parahaemolyticus]HBC3831114.1 hypothetical protein [Vibrio parahaemolyticus]